MDSGGVGMKEERVLTVLLSLLCRGLTEHGRCRDSAAVAGVLLACLLSMPLQHHMSVEEQCRREL